MKMKLALFLVAVAFLTGCSVVEQIDRSVNYTSEATTYVEQAAEFARKLPDLAQQTAKDPEVKEKLVAELEAMKQRVADFNALDAPAVAADVHAKLQKYNASLQQEIDQVLNGLNEIPAVQAVKDSQIVQTLTEITRLMEQINNLGG
jgi:ABC-type transporter Mla subunit MlaD